MATRIHRIGIRKLSTVYNEKEVRIVKSETIYVTCDMCGAIEASELRFSTHGGNYAMDLCETDKALYESLIRPFVDKAHKVRPAPMSIRKDQPPKSKDQPPKAKRIHRRKAVDNG